MSRNKFKAIVLDLFGTLVDWHPEWLPIFEWNGERFPSTLPLLVPILEEHFGKQFELDSFIRAYHSVLQEIASERQAHEVEVTCQERFIRTLKKLDVNNFAHAIEELAERLTMVHMEAVRRATSMPAPHRDVVEWLVSRYRLGLLSNFDEAKTGRQIVQDTGVSSLFEVVIISAEVGIRKPNPRIFELTLSKLALEPNNVLYVGDTLYDDVLGAKRVRLPVVWLKRGRKADFESYPKPDFILENLLELPKLLETIDE